MKRVAWLSAWAVVFFVFQLSSAWGEPRSAREDNLRATLRRTLIDTHTQVIGYGAARNLIVGRLHLEVDENGGGFVRDVYCQEKYEAKTPGGQVASSGINVEHTWPQSRFVGGPLRHMMKSDMHHLFPANSRVNAQRGNFKFGDGRGTELPIACDESHLTQEGSRPPRFEPPAIHKGNVARALFYYAVHYDARIDADEEALLREWHRQDPPDQAEIRRNDEIEKLQGNRNPFIDHPNHVDQIADF